MQHFGLKQIIIIIAGIALIGFGIFAYINTANLVASGSETTATVVERTQGGRHTASRTYVEYIVDGVLYRNRLSIQFAHTYIGQEVAILYNPDNPRQITPSVRAWATDDLASNIISGHFIVGVLLILVGMRNGWRHIKKSKQATAVQS